MNVFQLNYDARLRSWYDLRTTVEKTDTLTKCVEIDKWWQQAPLVAHYLHPLDIQQWPSPWELLVDNTFCPIARGLGMVYTLWLSGITDIDFVEAIDRHDETTSIVIVDSRYILNYYPGSVLTTSLSEFTIKSRYSMEPVLLRIK